MKDSEDRELMIAIGSSLLVIATALATLCESLAREMIISVAITHKAKQLTAEVDETIRSLHELLAAHV